MKNISLHWLQGIFETVPNVYVVWACGVSPAYLTKIDSHGLSKIVG